MRVPRFGPAAGQVSVAALVALPVAGYMLVLRAVAPPDEANWSRADPILTLLSRELTLWMSIVLPFAVAVAWWRVARPTRAELGSGLRQALAGAAVVVLVVGLLRIAAGPTLPAFIPPEESAGPGFLLSMSAGLDEEVVCRLVILPVGYFVSRARLGPLLGGTLSVALTALFFAIWHAVGEAQFSTAFFVTRFIVPGCIMSVVWLMSPPAIVAGHATAHVMIPALFAA